LSGPGENQKVGFMVIGAQKAGTTALFDYLGDDARLNLSSDKEPHFFDDESQDWSAPNYEAYHSRFAPDHPGLKGEATPIYVFWPQSLERIVAYNRDAKLILLLRDPVERAFSNWKMEYARGTETESFSVAIREGRQRLAGKPANDPDRRVFSYVERGFYGAQVQRILSLFPRPQILIELAQELKSDPAAVLGRVYDFLGLAPPAADPASRIVHAAREMNYGSKLTASDAAYLRDIYEPDQRLLEGLTGVQV